MTREDVLLLVTDGGSAGAYDIDPVRLMKGAFLVAQLGQPEWRDLFSFRAYDYGPFDPAVYRARDALLAEGLLARDTSRQYDAYTLTDRGHEQVAVVARDEGDESATWIRSVGAYVASRSFNTLLNEVYERYPQYAERSVLRR